jgi:TrpR-related protein YerC/YecD
MRKLSKRDIDRLFRAILSLRTPSELRLFFRDLLTETEISEIAGRWKVVRMVAGGIPYSTIIAETGLSSRTVARAARWVKRGKGGFKMMLKKAALRGNSRLR